jgi:hypothetical protein
MGTFRSLLPPPRLPEKEAQSSLSMEQPPTPETEFDIGLRRMVEAFVTITWLALNLGLNFFNKWAFTPDDENFDGAGFTFPIFFTFWNMVASFFGANVLMILAPATRTISFRQFNEHKLSLLVLSLVFVSCAPARACVLKGARPNGRTPRVGR